MESQRPGLNCEALLFTGINLPWLLTQGQGLADVNTAEGQQMNGYLEAQAQWDQRLDQELTWSWGHRPRREAMAPPPPLAASTPLLHGEFGSYPDPSLRLALTLTPQALHIQKLRPKPEARPRGGLVLLTEVSGCCTLRSCNPSDSAAYFCIYTYPRGRRRGRRKATHTFQADGAATYEENRAEAQRWATALTCLLRGLPLPGDGDESEAPGLMKAAD